MSPKLVLLSQGNVECADYKANLLFSPYIQLPNFRLIQPSHSTEGIWRYFCDLGAWVRGVMVWGSHRSDFQKREVFFGMKCDQELLELSLAIPTHSIMTS